MGDCAGDLQSNTDFALSPRIGSNIRSNGLDN